MRYMLCTYVFEEVRKHFITLSAQIGTCVTIWKSLSNVFFGSNNCGYLALHSCADNMIAQANIPYNYLPSAPKIARVKSDDRAIYGKHEFRPG